MVKNKYSKEMKKTRRRVENTMKENREDCILLGGDLNERIRERGARSVENAEKKNGWEVLNRRKQWDEEGLWKYKDSRGKQ
jgi:hypothetical protein